MGRFSIVTLSQMRFILQTRILAPHNSRDADDYLTFLARYFTDSHFGSPVLHIVRFQNVANALPLFRSGLTERILRTVDRDEEYIPDTNEAEPGDNDRPLPFYEPTDIVEGFTGHEEEIMTVYNKATQAASVYMGLDVPSANHETVYRRQAFKAMLLANSGNMVTNFTNYMNSLVDGDFTQETCNELIAHCTPKVQELQEAIMSEENARIIDYLISANPRDRPPVDIINTCKRLVSDVWTNTEDAWQNAPVPKIKEATTNALALWGASLSIISVNVAAGAASAAAGAARAAKNKCKRFFSFLLPAPALAELQERPVNDANLDNVADQLIQLVEEAAQEEEPQQANVIANNLIQAIDQVGPNDEVENLAVAQNSALNPNALDMQGGRSRSRKRSASKRTRRKGGAKKQKSKKNKRQSRRYVRRASSRKGRK
jgi:hypothetical protein